jgi:hypothetical protein
MFANDDSIAYYCLPFVEPHALFRAFMLAHPDADVEWCTAEDGSSDVLFDDRTERCFRRWHHAIQEATVVPQRGALWMHAVLEPWGWPPV